MDPNIIFGIVKEASFVFWPIVAPFAIDAVRGVAKDYAEQCFKKVFTTKSQNILTKATGKAVQILLQLIQDELTACGVDEANQKVLIPQMESFVKDEHTKAAIENAFLGAKAEEITRDLAIAWRSTGGSLPDGFGWKRTVTVFLSRVKGLRQQSKELNEALAMEATIETPELLRDIVGVRPGFDIEAYRDALLKRYSRLNIDSLDTSAPYYQEMKLWDVFVPQMLRECQEFMPQVLEIPKEHKKKLREQGELDEKTDRDEEKWEEARKRYLNLPPMRALEALKDPSLGRLVILGEPGGGKSSLLRYKALSWAQLPGNKRDAEPLPLFMELRDYAHWDSKTAKSFLRYWVEHPRALCHFDERLLDKQLRTQGGTVLLLDGLDEVFDPEQRKDVVGEIQRITMDYPLTRIVLTSRVIGYAGQPFRGYGFMHFMIQDFEDPEISTFIDTWHDRAFTNAEERERKRERIKRSLKDSSRIRELAGNPLLLTMMAILNRRQELPRDRSELYEQCTRVLLDLWDTERLISNHPELKDNGIDLRDKQAILRLVAYKMQTAPIGEAGNIIHEDDLEAILCSYLKDERGFSNPRPLAGALIEQLRERNFALCLVGGKFYSFVHRTFMEHYCASEIVEQFQKRRTLTPEQLKETVFGSHCNDENWHEVLCLVVGRIDEDITVQIIRHLTGLPSSCKSEFRNIFLCARFFEEVRNPFRLKEFEGPLLKHFARLANFKLPFNVEYDDYELTQLTERIRIVALNSIPLIIRDREVAKKVLLKYFHSEAATIVRKTVLQELARGWHNAPEMLRLLVDIAQEDRDKIVRQMATRELARGWHDAPEVFPFLKSIAFGDDDWVVRQAAVQELARGWQNENDLFHILKTIAVCDEDKYVRQAAVEELVRGSCDNPHILPWLKSIIQEHKDLATRIGAVHALARGYHNDPDVMPRLKNIAQRDGEEDLQEAAVRELAQGWHNEPDVLPILIHVALWANSEYVRRAAVEELAQGWHSDPNVLLILKHITKKQGCWADRQAAIRGLARGWHDDPDVLPILKEIALEVRDKYIPFTALEELKHGWHDDPDVLALFKNMTQKDEDCYVRRMAIKELARGWHDDPDVLPILKNSAQKDEDVDVRQAAVHELTRGWGDDPEIQKLLRKCEEAERRRKK